MSCALDSDGELALLTRVEARLCAWFDLSVHVYETLQSFDVFVVKICRNVFFETSCHEKFSLKWNLTEIDWAIVDLRSIVICWFGCCCALATAACTCTASAAVTSKVKVFDDNFDL